MDTKPQLGPDTLVRSWIVSALESHRPLLSIALRQRAKFEGWLKFELAAYAAAQGASEVVVEAAAELDDLASAVEVPKSRGDLRFRFGGHQYDIELKTCNTNWRLPGVLSCTRPITKNLQGVVRDSEKLRSCAGYGIVAFCMFPVEPGDNRWLEHLATISRSVGLCLSSEAHASQVRIPLEGSCKAEIVVVSFLVEKRPRGGSAAVTSVLA